MQLSIMCLRKAYDNLYSKIWKIITSLNHFLFKVKAVGSDKCYYREKSQTLRHILMQCPLYTDLRKTLTRSGRPILGSPPITMQFVTLAGNPLLARISVTN